MTLNDYLEDSIEMLKATMNADLNSVMSEALEVSCKALRRNKIIAVAGNGGSHADSLHLVAELVNWFTIEHQALPFIAIGANGASSSAWANDHSFESQFTRELSAFGGLLGVYIVLTTSGKSKNIIDSLQWAKSHGVPTVGFIGRPAKTRLQDLLDFPITVPGDVTPRIQEVHLNLYHYYCKEIERRLTSDRVIP